MRPIFHFTERRIEAHMFAFALSPIKYMRNWSELSKKRTLTWAQERYLMPSKLLLPSEWRCLKMKKFILRPYSWLINIGRYAHYLTSPMNRNDLGGALTKSGKRGGCAKTLFSTKSPLPHIAVAGVIFIFWMFWHTSSFFEIDGLLPVRILCQIRIDFDFCSGYWPQVIAVFAEYTG